jgi:hypothetical protein
MVASSANTNRPFAPTAWGDIARALATKAAMSSEADGLASGKEPALPDAVFCEGISVADFDLVGSPDMRRSQVAASLMWAGSSQRSMREGCANFSRPEAIQGSIGEDARAQFLIGA